MALALRLSERKAAPERLAITATVTRDEAGARRLTFNPDAMDLRLLSVGPADQAGSGRKRAQWRQKAWEQAPDPELTDDGDVIVRVDATTICGSRPAHPQG
jgi:hypothetical protein